MPLKKTFHLDEGNSLIDAGRPRNPRLNMRGGSRPGAGRPRIYGKRVQLSILISEETKTKLKELAIAQEKPLAIIVEQLIIDQHHKMLQSS
jgi:hypothetical protein